jgi:hypothetical protein
MSVIMNSFPRTQGALSRETYLTLLLLALVDQAGGELRISAQSLEKLDSGGKVLIDWDSLNQQAIIRSGSPSLIVAEVRGSGWTSTTSIPPSSSSPDPGKHRVMTEDQIINQMAERLRSENLKQWREQGAAAVAGMPPPEEAAR